MTALDKLIEAVEGGRLPGYDREFMALAEYPQHLIAAKNAYSGSLDAAKALHEALLPGWEWWCEKSDGNIFCSVRPVDRFLWDDYSYSDSPARAWLIAILKAYRSTL